MLNLIAGGLSNGLYNAATNSMMQQEQLRRDQLAKTAAAKAGDARQDAARAQALKEAEAKARAAKEVIARKQAEDKAKADREAAARAQAAKQPPQGRPGQSSSSVVINGNTVSSSGSRPMSPEEQHKVEEMIARSLADAKAKADAARHAIALNQSRP